MTTAGKGSWRCCMRRPSPWCRSRSVALRAERRVLACNPRQRGVGDGHLACRGARGSRRRRRCAGAPGRGGRRPPRHLRRPRRTAARASACSRFYAWWLRDAAAAGRHRRHHGRPRARRGAGRRAPRAAQLGSAFMLCPEAATNPAQRALMPQEAPHRAHPRVQRPPRARDREPLHARPPRRPDAPTRTSTTPPPRMRAAAREREDADGFNLWAGQAHSLAPRSCPPPTSSASSAPAPRRRWRKPRPDVVDLAASVSARSTTSRLRAG